MVGKKASRGKLGGVDGFVEHRSGDFFGRRFENRDFKEESRAFASFKRARNMSCLEHLYMSW